MSKSNVGVLLLDRASGAQIGFIRFDASGMIVYQVIEKGLHVFAFKAIDQLLNRQWLDQPLYKKHAGVLDENQKLPDEILAQEADACTAFLNSLESSVLLGEHIVTAQRAYVASGDE